MELLKKGRPCFDFILEFFTLLAILIIIFLFVSICVSVFMRYFLREPIGWTVQTSQYSLVFIAFLGAARVLKKDKHVTMDIITNRLSLQKKAVLGIFTSAIGMIVCLILTFCSTQVTIDQFQRNIHDMQVIEFPMGPIFTVITLGFFTLFIQFIRTGWGYVALWRASNTGQRERKNGRHGKF